MRVFTYQEGSFGSEGRIYPDAEIHKTKVVQIQAPRASGGNVAVIRIIQHDNIGLGKGKEELEILIRDENGDMVEAAWIPYRRSV